MGAQTCRTIVKECSTAWRDLVQIVEAIHFYTGLTNQLSKKLKLDKSASLSNTSAKLQGVQDITKEIRLDEVLKVCQKDLGQCKYSHIASLCENFVYVVHPSYIDKARSKMDNITNIVDVSRGQLGTLEKSLKLVLEAKPEQGSELSDHEHSEEDLQVVQALAKFTSLEQIEIHLLVLRSKILQIQENNLRVSFARLVAFQKTFMAYVQHTKKTLQGVDRNLVRVYQQQHLLLKKCYDSESELSEEHSSKLEKLTAILAKKFNSTTNQLLRHTKKVGWVVGNSTSNRVATTSQQQLLETFSQINQKLSAAVKKDVEKTTFEPTKNQKVSEKSPLKSSRGRLLQRGIYPGGQKVPPVWKTQENENNSSRTVPTTRPPQNSTVVPPRSNSSVITAPEPKLQILATPPPPPSSTSDFYVVRDSACLFGCVSLSVDLMGP